MKRLIASFIMLAVFSVFVSADFDFSKIKDRVSEFTLKNGLKFILLEDHSVPIASFVTYVDIGGSDEPIGVWGVSHFLEHMAFKGTSDIGTKNIKAERKAMAKLDAVFERLIAAKDSLKPDKEKIKKLEAEFEALKAEAAGYVVNNEFDSLLKRNGAVGLNAGTSKDATMYFYSLPSNKVELWAYLEATRFTDPVFREFYKEREVIKEERRLRTENQPLGKLIEELQAIAYKDHPYHTNAVGPMSNLNHITRAQMTRYFRANYTTPNIVIGVTGDVYPDQLKKLAKKYFSKLPSGRKNPGVFTHETEQLGEKTVTIFEDSQPWLIIAYHCPAESHEDFIKFSILDRIITNGRSSRLSRKMTIEDKSALGVISFTGYPGTKYPSLYMIGTLPNSGHTTDELLKEIDKEIEKIKEESVTEEELKSAKIRAKVSIIRRLGSNRGLLDQLLSAEVTTGSWKNAFNAIESIDKITTDDIQQLVKKYLIRSNRSIGRIEKKTKEEVKK
ncbi:MAG: insulinase family protein [bacterium]|nr:insulinase family protein [bacterium]